MALLESRKSCKSLRYERQQFEDPKQTIRLFKDELALINGHDIRRNARLTPGPAALDALFKLPKTDFTSEFTTIESKRDDFFEIIGFVRTGRWPGIDVVLSHQETKQLSLLLRTRYGVELLADYFNVSESCVKGWADSHKMCHTRDSWDLEEALERWILVEVGDNRLSMKGYPKTCFTVETITSNLAGRRLAAECLDDIACSHLREQLEKALAEKGYVHRKPARDCMSLRWLWSN